MYLRRKVLKYILPDEISKNKIKVTNQNFINIIENIFFDFGHENIFEFDNSINSLVGCWSFGTGHLNSLITINYGKSKLSPLLQKDSRS